MIFEKQFNSRGGNFIPLWLFFLHKNPCQHYGDKGFSQKTY